MLISSLDLVLPHMYLEDMVHMVQQYRFLGNTFHKLFVVKRDSKEKGKREKGWRGWGGGVNHNTSHNVVQDYTVAANADLFSRQTAVRVRATQSI